MPILLKNKTLPRDLYEQELLAIKQDPVFVPLLSHTLVDPSNVFSYLVSDEFEMMDAVIITSQKAVDAITGHLAVLPVESLLTLLSKPVYTVGPATANLLRAANFTDVRGSEEAGNGSILADMILEEAHKSGLKTFVFFTGETRKDVIPKKLNGAANITFVERVVYRTEILSDTQESFVEAFNLYQQSRSDKPWVVFFAPSGTEKVVEALKSYPADSYLISAIGPTTEAYLRENGLAPAAVAEKPTSEHLIKAMFPS